jgi:hypothetical protein
MLARRFGRLPAVISLVDIGQLHTYPGSLLRCLGHPSDLGTVAGTGRRHMQGQQVAQRVHRQVQLGALLALGAIVAGPLAALGRGAQGPAVQDHSTRLRIAACGQPQHATQVLGQGIKASSKVAKTLLRARKSLDLAHTRR